MLNCAALMTAVASLFFAISVPAAQMHKCMVNGTVSYQQIACPPDQPRKAPTVEELNAASKKKREAATLDPVDRAAPSNPAAVSGFSCDGRKVCSQMKSCAESKYFLANCPGTTMDGDKNGIPCEKQWCSR